MLQHFSKTEWNVLSVIRKAYAPIIQILIEHFSNTVLSAQWICRYPRNDARPAETNFMPDVCIRLGFAAVVRDSF